MLLETILFLTLKIKQNKFTKSVVRCEFDDLKIKNKKYFWGGGKGLNITQHMLPKLKVMILVDLL